MGKKFLLFLGSIGLSVAAIGGMGTINANYEANGKKPPFGFVDKILYGSDERYSPADFYTLFRDMQLENALDKKIEKSSRSNKGVEFPEDNYMQIAILSGKHNLDVQEDAAIRSLHSLDTKKSVNYLTMGITERMFTENGRDTATLLLNGNKKSLKKIKADPKLLEKLTDYFDRYPKDTYVGRIMNILSDCEYKGAYPVFLEHANRESSLDSMIVFPSWQLFQIYSKAAVRMWDKGEYQPAVHHAIRALIVDRKLEGNCLRCADVADILEKWYSRSYNEYFRNYDTTYFQVKMNSVLSDESPNWRGNIRAAYKDFRFPTDMFEK